VHIFFGRARDRFLATSASAAVSCSVLRRAKVPTRPRRGRRRPTDEKTLPFRHPFAPYRVGATFYSFFERARDARAGRRAGRRAGETERTQSRYTRLERDDQNGDVERAANGAKRRERRIHQRLNQKIGSVPGRSRPTRAFAHPLERAPACYADHVSSRGSSFSAPLPSSPRSSPRVRREASARGNSLRSAPPPRSRARPRNLPAPAAFA